MSDGRTSVTAITQKKALFLFFAVIFGQRIAVGCDAIMRRHS